MKHCDLPTMVCFCSTSSPLDCPLCAAARLKRLDKHLRWCHREITVSMVGGGLHCTGVLPENVTRPWGWSFMLCRQRGLPR